MTNWNDVTEPITVSQLITFLSDLPADMPVAYCCCSDYVLLSLDEIEVKHGIRKSHYIMRAYQEHLKTMSEENRESVCDFLVFPGN